MTQLILNMKLTKGKDVHEVIDFLNITALCRLNEDDKLLDTWEWKIINE